MNFDNGSESETDLYVCIREGWGVGRERVMEGGGKQYENYIPGTKDYSEKRNRSRKRWEQGWRRKAPLGANFGLRS